jgi:DNA-binding NarL/FixJ family response regulator
MHPMMRALIVALLHREPHCWCAIDVPALAGLPSVLSGSPVDLVVVDGVNFPACCSERAGAFPLGRVVVIGSESDDAYRVLALAQGAGAWLPRERVAEDLTAALRHAARSSPPWYGSAVCSFGPAPADPDHETGS